MASYFKLKLEKIRLLRTEAETLQEEVNEDIQSLIDEGFVAARSDEEPIRAVNRFVLKIVNGDLVTAANVKGDVPCTRDLTHRGITAILAVNPLLQATETRDQFGLKQFRRIDQVISIPEALPPVTEQAMAMQEAGHADND